MIAKLVTEKCCDSVDRRYVMEGLLNIEKMLKPGIGTKLFYTYELQFIGLSLNVYYFFVVAVLSRIHALIGCFAKDYSDCIENADGPKIRDMYFKTLEKAAISQQDVNVQLIDSIRFVL